LYLNLIHNKQNLKFLVDTGADISVIKIKHLNKNHINDNDSCTITGISNDKIKTLGRISINLTYENINLLVAPIKHSHIDTPIII
jgi:Retroviral aspartyl protease